MKSRDSLAKNEADILKDEKKAREDLEAADELLSDATPKLHDAFSASTVNRQSVSVATMMLDTARNKQEQAMQQLEAVAEKRKSLDTKTHKLLQKAIPSAQPPAKNLRNRVKSCHFCDGGCYNCIVEVVTCFPRTMFC